MVYSTKVSRERECYDFATCGLWQQSEPSLGYTHCMTGEGNRITNYKLTPPKLWDKATLSSFQVDFLAVVVESGSAQTEHDDEREDGACLSRGWLYLFYFNRPGRPPTRRWLSQRLWGWNYLQGKKAFVFHRIFRTGAKGFWCLSYWLWGLYFKEKL